MTQVWVALIAGVIGPTVVALIGLVELRRRVGTPNGQGNLVEMMERLLVGQARQDERLADLERQQNRTASHVGRIDRQLRERAPVIAAVREHLSMRDAG